MPYFPSCLTSTGKTSIFLVADYNFRFPVNNEYAVICFTGVLQGRLAPALSLSRLIRHRKFQLTVTFFVDQQTSAMTFIRHVLETARHDIAVGARRQTSVDRHVEGCARIIVHGHEGVLTATECNLVWAMRLEMVDTSALLLFQGLEIIGQDDEISENWPTMFTEKAGGEHTLVVFVEGRRPEATGIKA